MAIVKQNGDVIPFIKQKDYIMVNNNLGGGSFGKTVLLQDPFIDELFVAKKYEPAYDDIREQFYKNFLLYFPILICRRLIFTTGGINMQSTKCIFMSERNAPWR